MALPSETSVLIVGAGPAGLVTAKILKQAGYTVTVYERAERVGGMWRDERGGLGDKCSPDMRTNLSRFTVALPDLSWKSVDTDALQSGPNAPLMFPKAWQAGKYLETYAGTFGIIENIILGTRVVDARLQDNRTWKVTSDDGSGRQSTITFDRLIIASGFFGKPCKSFDPSPSKDLPNIKHSSRFRNVSELSGRPGKIAVIGGGISGSEAASQAAFQISNAQHSPSKEKPVHAASTVYHIFNRPFYCLQRYLPQDPQDKEGKFNQAPIFLPLDLVLYNLSRRGDGEITAAIATVPPEKAKKGHDFLRSSLGGDQSDFGYPKLTYDAEHMQHPGYTGITDTYMEFVRDGTIVPVQGWVDKVNQQSDRDLFDIELKQYKPWYHSPEQEAAGTSKLTDVTGIIEATGYKTDLDWLDPQVRELLNDKDTPPNARIPFVLSRGSIFANKFPTLGFVGFYEGPYWGVMETQARFLAEAWAKQEITTLLESPDREIYKPDSAKYMREAMKKDPLQVPQFWMSDYVGLIEEFAREAGLSRDDSAFDGKQTGPAFPSRYQGANTGTQAKEVVQEVAELIKASSENARFVAAAVFTAMQGIWNIHRKIESRTNTPGGIFTGTAHFHPRDPTDPTLYSAEYLYVENGTFTIDNGLSFPATRRYVYRYSEARDKITAWFVGEDNESVGALFNTWEFYAPEDENSGWMAKGYHWCDPDTYRNTCEFRFRGVRIERFMVRYEVQGPKKDYQHESWYERPRAEDLKRGGT
ncbi:hypothetical protein COCCADRAFT_608 [Bipolaris zeicola 26-R-13]|uniref:Uncharacterized protein n=1 Tax=Cochliobolus carbonum (strain 26-R-13) TaxID=930089 RepID=W6YM48_COCC2|nr:uncharacterized protein COCCADRAFT_608 [Bipolaris zeicola 26-R-13]EUC38588.1 hypothetical protein COCCADRAFT_608 [Bipolaris zeicola 26-R-13]